MIAPPTPGVELVAPGRPRVTVVPRSPDDQLGDVADALGLDPREPLTVDGRPVDRQETLARAGLLRGSRLDIGGANRPPADATADPAVTVVVEAGPGAGVTSVIGPGRHIVGRAPAAAVHLADPTLEPHHALLDVTADGTAVLTQLTGRVPCRLDGEPIAGSTIIVEGAVVALGASRIRLGCVTGPGPDAVALAPSAGDPWRRAVHRSPRARPHWAPVPITVPAPMPASLRPPAAGLVAAAFTLAGSVAVAVVLRSPLFLVFGAVGVCASLGVWVAGRIGAARDGRRAGACREREVAVFAAAVATQRTEWWHHHVAAVPVLSEAVAAATTARGDLWSRRPDHGDAFVVSLGWGPVEWTVALAEGSAPPAPELRAVVDGAQRFDDASVAADLGPDAALAVSGPTATATAAVRALVVQLAAWVGPVDWRLVVVAHDPSAWDWSRWLPHATLDEGASVVAADDERLGAMFAALDDGCARHVVVVTDRPDLLAQRTGPLRRFLASDISSAVVVAVPSGDAVPALCRSVLEIGSLGTARWWPDVARPTQCQPVHVAGLAEPVAADVARALAALTDPEDPAATATGLSSAVTLGGLCAQYGVGAIDDPIAIAAAWHEGGHDPAPAAVLGLTGDGVVEVDLVRDGPHALVAGMTGSGKSELLRTLVVALAARCSPDHLTFVLVDYKGGATFDACADLPHTVGLVTDLDGRLAERALVSLDAEIRRRERLLRAAGADHLGDYRSVPGRSPLPRLVVVIDEFATLAEELPDFLSSLVGIARRGRSLGIHLVLATQRPDGALSDDIRGNTPLRLALRLQSVSDARDVVDDESPARFPRGAPGRVMMRLGEGDSVVFQSARSTGLPSPRRDDHVRVVDGVEPGAAGDASDLTVLVQSIRNAAALSDVAAPHRPWLPPLPAHIAAGAGTVGLVDVPAEQRQEPLRWTPADGNLALVGALGSGTTTTLLAVLVAACNASDPADRHVYVVDARGDDRLDALEGLAHCGGVVRPHERERLGRLLQRMVDELDARRAGGGRGRRPEIVVAVDGVPALRAVLDGPYDGGAYEQLGRIVAEGPAVGIACVLTAERPGALPPALLGSCAERWVLHLDDPSEGVTCGVPAALVPAPVPGRVVVASRRLEAQIGVTVVPASAGDDDRGPVAIGVLPARIAARALPRAVAGDDGVALTAGVAFDTLGVARLDVPDGEHVLVAGPARSGRTTALVRLARSWHDAHPDGHVAIICPVRRSPLATWPGAVEPADLPGRGPCLVVVDDAERVDDADGVLAGLVAQRRPGLLVIAAGRPDALRTLYGHWTGVVRRSRLGVLMSMCADTDGDVLGELLPRHPPLPPRPGLAWLVAAGRHALAQLAVDE